MRVFFVTGRKGRHQKTINVHEESEVDWWMRKLGVSYEQLRQAVSKVGPDAAKVAKYLNRALPRDL